MSHFGHHHNNVLGELARDAFVVGAAVKPRRTAVVMASMGVVAFAIFALMAVGKHNTAWIGVGIGAFVFFLVLAIIARIIGGIAGMGMEAAQDVIHDRYEPGRDVGEVHYHFHRYDPRTGEPLRPQFDPYTGERL